MPTNTKELNQESPHPSSPHDGDDEPPPMDDNTLVINVTDSTELRQDIDTDPSPAMTVPPTDGGPRAWWATRPLVLLLLRTPLIKHPGDSRRTILQSVGLATTMLPVATSPWPLISLDPNQRKVKFAVSFFSLFMGHPQVAKFGCKRRN